MPKPQYQIRYNEKSDSPLYNMWLSDEEQKLARVSEKLYREKGGVNLEDEEMILAQQNYISTFMSKITNGDISNETKFEDNKLLIKYIIEHSKVDGKVPEKKDVYTVNDIYNKTNDLIYSIKDNSKKVEVPNIEIEATINSLVNLYKREFSNKPLLVHEQDLKETFEDFENTFREFLNNPEDNRRFEKLANGLNNVEEACDKYQFMNSNKLSKNVISEEYKNDLKKIQASKSISQVVNSVKYSIQTRMKIDMKTKQPIDKDTFENKLTEVLSQENAEQFLLKFTNSKTLEEGLIRLNSMYIKNEANSNDKDYDKVVKRDWGIDGLVGDKKSILETFSIRTFDIFDKESVKDATVVFYKKFKNKVTTDMSIYMLKSEVEKETEDSKMERLSFEKICDSKTLKNVYENHPPKETKKVVDNLNSITEKLNLKLEGKASQSTEYKNFREAFNKLQKGKDAYPNEKLLKEINNLMNAAEGYIMAKRGQKRMSSETDILNDEINKKMVSKIHRGFGKERYMFAVNVYREMKAMKENLEKEMKTDMKFTQEKTTYRNEINRENNGTNTKNMLTQKIKDTGLSGKKNNELGPK